MERYSGKKTREEALYWKSLNPVFKVDLRGDFHSRLEIPVYFTDNLKGRLPRKVALRGPSTDIDTWDVLVATTTYTSHFTGEVWRNFATSFGLEENDTLLFKYKDNSYFKVRVINGKTGCEKESSHFVSMSTTRADQSDSHAPFLVKTEIEEEKKTNYHKLNEGKNVAIATVHDDYDPELVKVSYKRDDTTDCDESSGSPYVETRKRNAEAALAPCITPLSVRVKTEYTPFSYELEGKRNTERIENTKEKAKMMQNMIDNSFFVALSRSHVSSGHVKLGVPREWWNTVIKFKKSQIIQLRRKDGDQVYSCYCAYDESKNTATITSGWKAFVTENALSEHDCCLFKLAKPWKENEVIYLEEIPLYFTENLKGKLPRKVALKGPSTDIDTWEVLVTTTTDITSIIGEGWRNFATTFSLEQNDTLVFKYKNNSYFKVRVISGKTSCEKESSHFVKMSTPGVERADNGRMLIKNNQLAPLPCKSTDESIDCEVIESSRSPCGESETRKRNAGAVAGPPTARVKTENKSSPSQDVIGIGQRERAKDRAKKIQMFMENSFYVSLSCSHVSPIRAKLTIPRPWWDKVIKSNKNQTIQLRCTTDDQFRPYLCFCHYSEKHNISTITSGWKEFVEEKALQENDCCVFKLSNPWKEYEIIYLDVAIVRVLDS